MTVQDTGHRHAFLSTEQASPGNKRLARAVVVLSVLAFMGGVAFVRTPLAAMPVFIPAYELGVWISDTLTAALLFGQFTRLRSRALLLLATGYLFDGLMVIPHALSFPGAFSPTGLLGSGPQTTAWLYVFWHGGFPLFVLAFALLSRRPGDTVRGSPAVAIVIAVGATVAASVSLTLVATLGHDMLPVVMRGGDYSMLVSKGISPAIWGLSLGALLVLRRQKNPTVLELWLMVAMVAWLLDILFAAVIGSHRFDLGFYAGRVYGLLAASFVLGVLLIEMNRLYDNLADALELAKLRNDELLQSREEFARVQRFEAVGQLVGGVAHDFNNLLTVIIGSIDLALRDINLAPRTQRVLEMSMTSARRGAELTAQLLTFALKQVLHPEVLNANEVIARLQAFFARTTGGDIAIVTELSPVVWPTRIDRAQFETALLNLVLNARDALEGQGRIVISTRNVVLYSATVPDLPPGDYLCACVTDTGRGMPADVVARAVDPFFTTKEIGTGSGLGLSQVSGFVRGATGAMRIVSEPGKGTSVEIYLPKSTERLLQTLPVPTSGLMPIRPANGEETILVVENDPDMLNVAVSGLIELGYEVKTATNGNDALAILRRDNTIDVLFSDSVMPGGMNGAQLSVEARRIRPSLKVLLTSGYAASTLSEDDGVSGRPEVLRKPYQRDELASKLRLVIGD